MNHQSHKTRFGNGRDADRMLMRKLCYNFLRSGKLTTTYPKAKALKTHLDKLVSRLSDTTESNKKYVAQRVLDARMQKDLFVQLADHAQKINGGYVSIERGLPRSSDGAVMATLTWAHGISFVPRASGEQRDKDQSAPIEANDENKKEAVSPASTVKSKKNDAAAEKEEDNAATDSSTEVLVDQSEDSKNK